MNDIQIKNILTPICGIVATFLASKLNFLGIDQTTWMTLVTTIVFTAVAAVLGYFGKTTNVIDTAGATRGTTVVTTPEIANALPNNPDVIPATPEIVTAVKHAG